MESEWGRLNNKIMAVHLDELSLDLHKLLQQRPIPLAVASKGEGLKPLDRWDRFPLRAWMFFSRVCCVSCRAAFATNWSFVQRNSTHFRHETCQNMWRSKNLFLSGQQPLIKNTLMCNLRMWFPNVMLFMTIIGVIKTLVLFQHNGLIFNVHLNDGNVTVNVAYIFIWITLASWITQSARCPSCCWHYLTICCRFAVYKPTISCSQLFKQRELLQISRGTSPESLWVVVSDFGRRTYAHPHPPYPPPPLPEYQNQNKKQKI